MKYAYNWELKDVCVYMRPVGITKSTNTFKYTDTQRHIVTKKWKLTANEENI